MKNYFSTAIIALALALLVPNNGAEAVGPVTGMLTSGTISVPVMTSMPQEMTSNVSTASSSGSPAPGPYAWVMALGFLGFVVTRRLRGD